MHLIYHDKCCDGSIGFVIVDLSVLTVDLSFVVVNSPYYHFTEALVSWSDLVVSLLDIGSLGRPGVELSGFHDEVTRVLQILPIIDEPSFITVCSGNMLHKWGFFNVDDGTSELVLQQSYKLAGGR